jgi:hypothetical protein
VVVTQTWSIAVAENRNRPPTITSTPRTVAAVGFEYRSSVTASDPDGDPLTFLLVEPVPGLSVNQATGVLSWVPEEDQVGSQTVAVLVHDGGGATRRSRSSSRCVRATTSRC